MLGSWCRENQNLYQEKALIMKCKKTRIGKQDWVRVLENIREDSTECSWHQDKNLHWSGSRLFTLG